MVQRLEQTQPGTSNSDSPGSDGGNRLCRLVQVPAPTRPSKIAASLDTLALPDNDVDADGLFEARDKGKVNIFGVIAPDGSYAGVYVCAIRIMHEKRFLEINAVVAPGFGKALEDVSKGLVKQHKLDGVISTHRASQKAVQLLFADYQVLETTFIWTPDDVE